MPSLPGLRRAKYAGSDPNTDQFARGVTDFLKFLQTLPFSDGVAFENVDFGAPSDATTKTYQLKHGLDRKARGISVLSCRCKYDPPTLPMGVPVHVASQDTDSVAYVCLSAAMASDFTWSFWVY